MVGKENQKPLIGNPYLKLDRNRPRNMVFYGRVSTEHEAQLSALENQVQWYDDQAKYHPNWTVLNKYIDEGITGTQAKKRPAFLQMLEDARAGKFDLIVTREVCRFARNTVDTLVTTRELKNIGIEVYFVEDNIWTLDGDGELRLTIMATLAQEESRKVSERVKAGQQISREKGTIYGAGNILGYDRVDGTYVINPEQAETIRMMFDLYVNEGLGGMKIASELTRRGRLNASGINRWTTSYVMRALANPTYTGTMAYGKSYRNNYLEQKRINNHNPDTYMYVKCDFEPIISEELFNKCKAIRESRTSGSLTDAIAARKGERRHGMPQSADLWCNKLRCGCGSRCRKNVWYNNKKSVSPTVSYGYECYSQINNGSAHKRVKAGVSSEGYCGFPMIAGWKLGIMSQRIMESIWSDRKGAIELACDLINECQREETKKTLVTPFDPSAEIERLKKKRSKLIDLYAEDCISKSDFEEQRQKIDNAILSLEEQAKSAEVPDVPEEDAQGLRWEKIKETLEETIDLTNPEALESVLWKFIARVEPVDKTHFRWYVNLDGETEEKIEAIVEGRKNNPVVMLDIESEQDNKGVGADAVPPAPLHISEDFSQGVLDSIGGICYNSFSEREDEEKLSSLISQQDRQPSRRTRKRIPPNSNAPGASVPGVFVRFVRKEAPTASTLFCFISRKVIAISGKKCYNTSILLQKGILPMKTLYDGKTKTVLLDEETGVVNLLFKDTATGENGMFDPGYNTVGGSVEGKGKIGLRISKYFFEIMAKNGIPTHYLGADIDNCLMQVKKLTVPKLEFVLRYFTAGSMCRRFTLPEGIPFDPPYKEVTLKDDEQGDPLITERLCLMKGMLKPGMYDEGLRLVEQVGEVLKRELCAMDLQLIDFKIEIGYDEDGKVYVVDEITPDIWRVKDKNGVIPNQIDCAKLILEKI
ncbi:MAG: recombinase family protein [Oscillospiraceae bacterium]|nr:recombinase family protein [Lachnospiraceae bacterium]MBR4744370.1 recombinase family protein [Oscillospiraceae bacterium]